MFLDEPQADAAVTAIHQADVASDGYVHNFTRLWAWRPEVAEAFADLRTLLLGSSTLSDRERAVLVCATASTLGDAYCSLAWGRRLAALVDDDTASSVLGSGRAAALTAREQALADWAARIVRDPNATTQADVDALRAAGLDDREIFEATTHVALRLAFSTVNDALGAVPDAELRAAVPAAVRDAVSFGR